MGKIWEFPDLEGLIAKTEIGLGLKNPNPLPPNVPPPLLNSETDASPIAPPRLSGRPWASATSWLPAPVAGNKPPPPSVTPIANFALAFLFSSHHSGNKPPPIPWCACVFHSESTKVSIYLAWMAGDLGRLASRCVAAVVHSAADFGLQIQTRYCPMMKLLRWLRRMVRRWLPACSAVRLPSLFSRTRPPLRATVGLWWLPAWAGRILGWGRSEIWTIAVFQWSAGIVPPLCHNTWLVVLGIDLHQSMFHVSDANMSQGFVPLV